MIVCFAYGSNLASDRMATRCPGCRLVGVGYVNGFRLAFTRESLHWAGAVADLQLSPHASVWGAVFEVTDTDLKRLDAFEGVPTAYHRQKLPVHRADGSIVEAWTYLVTEPGPETLPSFRYWKALVDGGTAVGLPDEYLAFLRSLPHKDLVDDS